MHAQVLALGWLLAAQLSPTTEFAPNVSVARPGQTAPEFSPATDASPLMGTEEAVDLEPVPESTPGVEFQSRGGVRSAGNSLRSAPPAVDRTADEDGVTRTSYANAGNRPVAELLVKHGLTPPDADAARILGQPASLVTLLERVADRSARIAVIRAYWTLTAEVASANWAAEEVEFVRGLSAENGGADRAEIEAARLDAVARWQEAKLAAVSAQHELAQICRLSVTTGESLPLPRDLPLVTAYTTNFERIFASRAPSSAVRQLAATIPLQFDLLDTRAASVSKGRDALKEVRHAYQQGTADLALLLSSQDRLNASQRSFLNIVRRYNEAVAAYANEVGGGVDNGTFVSMLIPSPTGLRTGSTRTAAAGRSTTSGYAPNGYAPSGTAAQNYSAPGYAPGRTTRGSIDSSVRPTGEFAPAAPPGNSSWGPANRAPTGASSNLGTPNYGAPALSRPPTRFGE